jgi:hypothetical protein
MPAPFNDINATHTSARRQKRLSHRGTANSDDFAPAPFCCCRTASRGLQSKADLLCWIRRASSV